MGHVNVRLRSSGSFSLRSSWPAARFDLLMLTPHRKPVDMHGNGHHDFGVPDGLPGSVVDVAGFDPFPFGPAVLEPDFDLDLAEFERVRDLRALGEGQILLTVKLLLEFQQLFASESSPPPPALSRRAARR